MARNVANTEWAATRNDGGIHGIFCRSINGSDTLHTVLPPPTPSRDEELLWREAVLAELGKSSDWPNLSPSLLNDLYVYRGGAGIWFDVQRTSALTRLGVAVSVRHTGRHYADDMTDKEVIYHYPTTGRAPASDANEIQSVKNAQLLDLPIFVVTENGSTRQVRKGWVVGANDVARVFLIEFSDTPPPALSVQVDTDRPFERRVQRDLTIAQIQRRNRSPRFKFEAIQRYGNRCVVTGTDVVEMLDAAHVIPVEKGGSDDPRNSLLLTASAHRAFDARLWAIHPTTLRVETKENGPTIQCMKILNADLSGLRNLPHKSALEWRYKHFLGRDVA